MLFWNSIRFHFKIDNNLNIIAKKYSKVIVNALNRKSEYGIK
jgi:hypothetical protein